MKKVSVYFAVPKDDKGELFDGSKHSYQLTFTKEQIPPAKNFWSWTNVQVAATLVGRQSEKSLFDR